MLKKSLYKTIVFLLIISTFIGFIFLIKILSEEGKRDADNKTLTTVQTNTEIDSTIQGTDKNLDGINPDKDFEPLKEEDTNLNM